MKEAILIITLVFFIGCNNISDSDNSYIAEVTNPSFELFSANEPSGWIVQEWVPRTSVITQDSLQKTEGSYSVKIIIPDTIPNTVKFSQDIKVEMNTEYKLSCDIKTDSVSLLEYKTFGAGLFIESAGFTYYSDSLISGTINWTNISVNFNSKNSDSIRLWLHFGHTNNTNTGTVWFDNVEIAKVN